MVSTVLSSAKLFADDTTLPVLDPGRGRTKTGRLWCYAVDDRPWAGTAHSAAAYIYSEDRRGERPAAHLAGFRGVLQVDGDAGFKSLAESWADGSVRLAFCWAHCRRRFYELRAATASPLAAEVLARIGKLYEIEADIRGQPADARRSERQERSRPGRGAACLAGGAGHPRVGQVGPGRGHPVCHPALAGPGGVPR